MELSEQAAQELAERSTAVGRVAELEAKVAELEAQDRRWKAEKVKAEEALCKEKCGKQSDQCLPSPFYAVLCDTSGVCTLKFISNHSNEILGRVWKLHSARKEQIKAKLYKWKYNVRAKRVKNLFRILFKNIWKNMLRISCLGLIFFSE